MLPSISSATPPPTTRRTSRGHGPRAVSALADQRGYSSKGSVASRKRRVKLHSLRLYQKVRESLLLPRRPNRTRFIASSLLAPPPMYTPWHHLNRMDSGRDLLLSQTLPLSLSPTPRHTTLVMSLPHCDNVTSLIGRFLPFPPSLTPTTSRNPTGVPGPDFKAPPGPPPWPTHKADRQPGGWPGRRRRSLVAARPQRRSGCSVGADLPEPFVATVQGFQGQRASTRAARLRSVR